MVKEDDIVVDKVQIGKTVFSSPLEVSGDTIASHLHVVQDTLTLLTELGIYLLLVGASHCFFTGLEPRPSGTLGSSGTLQLSVSLGDKGTRGRLRWPTWSP